MPTIGENIAKASTLYIKKIYEQLGKQYTE